MLSDAYSMPTEGRGSISRIRQVTVMSNQSLRASKTEMKDLFKIAVKAGVGLRVEFHPDGTIIASTMQSVPANADGDLDKWMREHHENQT